MLSGVFWVTTKRCRDGPVESRVTEDGGTVPDGMYDERGKTSKRTEEEE